MYLLLGLVTMNNHDMSYDWRQTITTRALVSCKLVHEASAYNKCIHIKINVSELY